MDYINDEKYVKFIMVTRPMSPEGKYMVAEGMFKASADETALSDIAEKILEDHENNMHTSIYIMDKKYWVM